jgi:hypothetical protein
MPTEVQIYKDKTIIPEDLSTGGPSWNSSGNLNVSSLTSTGGITNGGFDFILGNTDQSARGNSNNSRALVKDSAATLVLNYAGDFTGGVRVDSIMSFSSTVTINGGGGGTALRLNNGGDLQLFNGANNGSAILYCDNDNELRTNGDFVAFASDERLKTNIKPIENAVDKVLKLHGFTYNFNEIGEELGFDTSLRHSGVSAQEVQAVLPEAVCPAPASDEYLTVKYDKLVPLLIEAIKELKEEIKELKGDK